jgi:MerC mercury resistance protein
MNGPIASAPQTPASLRSRADSVGMALSLFCMIHCLAFPLLLSFAPAVMQLLPGDDVTHRCLSVGIGFAGLLAFRPGYRLHRRAWIVVLFAAGMTLISSAALLGGGVLTSFGEAAVTIGGSCLLLTAHWFNRSFCRSCTFSDCEEKHFGTSRQASNESIERVQAQVKNV